MENGVAQVPKSQSASACQLCFPESNQNLENAMILVELIDSLSVELASKRDAESSCGRIEKRAFLELIKCVYHQKEGINPQTLECEHSELIVLFCERLGIKQELLFEICFLNNFKLAKRLYQLELIKTLSRNTIKTILKEKDRKIAKINRTRPGQALSGQLEIANQLRKSSIEPTVKLEISELEQARSQESCIDNNLPEFQFKFQPNGFYYQPPCHYFYPTDRQNFF